MITCCFIPCNTRAWNNRPISYTPVPHPTSRSFPQSNGVLKTSVAGCFLLGSDYVFPHAANEIIKDQINALEALVVGEAYLPLGSQTVDKIIDNILLTRPRCHF